MQPKIRPGGQNGALNHKPHSYSDGVKEREPHSVQAIGHEFDHDEEEEENEEGEEEDSFNK